MRYHVKGGIWKNTEDEVLKAAVMKYGLNQWSRISSLIVRKSAKQCKERWYEWLDPNIKKTEWTRDEEEKLLHLAKMFPCQWKTIGSIIGRTAYQSMMHYEKLLDKAQGKDSESNPRNLRQGEIDPNPETKPARPDPIDMDEDEKEMLAEARARIANRRGKKAKRKEREKQLEEARRLAGLQKKRELKSAGIEVQLELPRKKKKEMDYNLDIPFERQMKLGSFDTAEEKRLSNLGQNKFSGAVTLQYLENRNRDEEEEKFRKLDEKRMKHLKNKDPLTSIEVINKLNDPKNIVKKSALELPEPRVTDQDLESMANLSRNINESLIPQNKSTNVLVGNFSESHAIPTSIRTPLPENSIMSEAKLAVGLREAQTPLIGGESSKNDYDQYVKAFTNKESKTPHGADSNAYTSRGLQSGSRSIMQDKPKGSIIRQSSIFNIGDSRDTPLRNSADGFLSNQWEAPDSKLPIKSILMNLPKPRHEFEIETTAEQVEELKQEFKDLNTTEKDHTAGDLYISNSMVVERNLKRPDCVNSLFHTTPQGYPDGSYLAKAEEMINNYTVSLCLYDQIENPTPNQRLPDLKSRNPQMEEELLNVTLKDRALAEALIAEYKEEIQEKFKRQISENSLTADQVLESIHLNPKTKQ